MAASPLTPNSDTQTERLVLALRERILKGEFSPGERLTELGLVSLLQASRTPIRLALERLANEGLLDLIPTGGSEPVHSAWLRFGTQSRFAEFWKEPLSDLPLNGLDQWKSSRE